MKRLRKYNGCSCAVPTCKNYSSVTGKSVTYHTFPKDKETQQRWIKLCGRPSTFNTNGRYVCSVHFTEEDYLRDLQNELLKLPLRRILKNGANPSINLSVRCDNEYRKTNKTNGEDNCIVEFECESLKRDDTILINNIIALKDGNGNTKLRQNTIEDRNETFENCTKITAGENEKFYAEMKKMISENENLRAEMKEITNDNKILRINTKEMRIENEKLYSSTKKSSIENENLHTIMKKITNENEKLRANIREISIEKNKLLNSIKEQKVAIDELQDKYTHFLSFERGNENMFTQSTNPAEDGEFESMENNCTDKKEIDDKLNSQYPMNIFEPVIDILELPQTEWKLSTMPRKFD